MKFVAQYESCYNLPLYHRIPLAPTLQADPSRMFWKQCYSKTVCCLQLKQLTKKNQEQQYAL
jgi:hypothetical protein